MVSEIWQLMSVSYVILIQYYLQLHNIDKTATIFILAGIESSRLCYMKAGWQADNVSKILKVIEIFKRNFLLFVISFTDR